MANGYPSKVIEPWARVPVKGSAPPITVKHFTRAALGEEGCEKVVRLHALADHDCQWDGLTDLHRRRERREEGAGHERPIAEVARLHRYRASGGIELDFLVQLPETGEVLTRHPKEIGGGAEDLLWRKRERQPNRSGKRRAFRSDAKRGADASVCVSGDRLNGHELLCRERACGDFDPQAASAANTSAGESQRLLRLVISSIPIPWPPRGCVHEVHHRCKAIRQTRDRIASDGESAGFVWSVRFPVRGLADE